VGGDSEGREGRDGMGRDFAVDLVGMSLIVKDLAGVEPQRGAARDLGAVLVGRADELDAASARDSAVVGAIDCRKAVV